MRNALTPSSAFSAARPGPSCSCDHADSWAARSANSQTFVAELHNSLVGFAIVERDGHLAMMYVHPAHQGKGIASALLARVESFARRHGLARLYTESRITARPYFEHRGFHLIAPQVVSARGQDFINYPMEKQL